MRRIRGVGLGLLGLLAMAGVWEAYKALGPANGVIVGGRAVLPRTGDRAMPHIWDMIGRLATGHRPQRALGCRTQSAFSLRSAAAGW